MAPNFMPTSDQTSDLAGLSFAKRRIIVLGLLIIVLLLILPLCLYRTGYLDLRLSRRGWNLSTGSEVLNSSDGTIHRDGRYFQVGPLILDCYYNF